MSQMALVALAAACLALPSGSASLLQAADHDQACYDGTRANNAATLDDTIRAGDYYNTCIWAGLDWFTPGVGLVLFTSWIITDPSGITPLFVIEIALVLSDGFAVVRPEYSNGPTDDNGAVIALQGGNNDPNETCFAQGTGRVAAETGVDCPNATLEACTFLAADPADNTTMDVSDDGEFCLLAGIRSQLPFFVNTGQTPLYYGGCNPPGIADVSPIFTECGFEGIHPGLLTDVMYTVIARELDANDPRDTNDTACWGATTATGTKTTCGVTEVDGLVDSVTYRIIG